MILLINNNFKHIYIDGQSICNMLCAVADVICENIHTNLVRKLNVCVHKVIFKTTGMRINST